MTEKPYIGITGPTSKEEVNLIVNEFHRAGFTLDSQHIPMLGFLVSYKTLNDIPADNLRYPGFADISELLQQTNNQVFTTVHYNTKNKDNLANEVSRVFNGIYQDDLCKGIQLNLVWPSLDQVQQIKKQFPEMKIIFQANHKVLSSGTPQEVAKEIKKYQDDISYLLIDPSGGKGEEFDMDDSIEIYKRLREQTPNLAIGFAGGFSGRNVESRLQTMTNKIQTQDFSIDAEGGLRDKLSLVYGDDLLNSQKVSAYLQNASKVLK